MVIPHNDARYYDLRKTIAIPEPGKHDRNASLPLDDQFSLHPALRPLHELYQEGKLIAIPACGSPAGTRSHFDAQDYMESGVAGNKQIRDGWMNRAIVELEAQSPFAAIALTTTLPRAMRGNEPAINIPELGRYEIGNADATGKIRRDADASRLLAAMYAKSRMAASATHSFAALDSLRKRKYRSSEVNYPEDDFARQLNQLAQLVKSDLGVRLAFVEIGGWDTHANQGGAVGQLAGNLYQLGNGLAAFFEDLGAQHTANVVVITMSEFGRTVKQNGNQGTDHGHGTTFLIMGAVAGGRVLGDFPGLSTDQLYDGRDVNVTTDYRDVLADILHHHMGFGSLQRVFPNHVVDQNNFPGLFDHKS
jgi:uncharacterized protein (DUF1501 family)